MLPPSLGVGSMASLRSWQGQNQPLLGRRGPSGQWAVGSLSGGAPLGDLTQCSSLVCTLQGNMGATGLVGAPGLKGEKGDMVSIGLAWETPGFP